MTLAYERTGAGPPLVLLHGIGHSRVAWRAVAARLAVEREVYAVDLPGHGESPLPAGLLGGLAMPELTGHVERFVSSLGLERRPAVAGNSLGGAIALELLKRDAVESAVALSPAGFWRPWEIRYAAVVLRSTQSLNRLPESVLDKLIRAAPIRNVLSGFYFARPDNLSIGDVVAGLHGFTKPGLGAILPHSKRYRFDPDGVDSERATVAWGDRDRLLLRRQANRARALLPLARYVTLQGCGHVPMSDDPDRVADVILDGTA